jgi:hypothetical protein
MSNGQIKKVKERLSVLVVGVAILDFMGGSYARAVFGRVFSQ